MKNKIKEEMNNIKIPKELSERSMIGINQAKGKFLFYIFLIILFIINSYLYGSIYYHLIPWKASHITTFITITLYFLAVIPFTAYASEKLAKFSLMKGLEEKKNFRIFITIVIIVPLILFSTSVINDNREKGLDDVINFNTSNFQSIIIQSYKGEWSTDNQEDAEKIKELFSQYRVKKMKDHEWDSDVSKEKGFSITINTKRKPIMASIYESRLIFYNDGDYYNVINGPIDVDSIHNLFIEDYQH